MILVQFYHMQDPCLNCALKNKKIRIFVYLLVQTKFQQLYVHVNRFLQLVGIKHISKTLQVIFGFNFLFRF
jgi:hypothetical protein